MTALTKVVIGAQYASGSRSKRATSTKATAATAVRTECAKTGRQVAANKTFEIRLLLRRPHAPCLPRHVALDAAHAAG